MPRTAALPIATLSTEPITGGESEASDGTSQDAFLLLVTQTRTESKLAQSHDDGIDLAEQAFLFLLSVRSEQLLCVGAL